MKRIIRKAGVVLLAFMFVCNLIAVNPAYAATKKAAATKTVAAGSTQAQIQAVINSAVAGDIISFSSGTYNFTSTLALKDGITIEGNNCTWAGNNTSNIVKVIDAAALKNFTIKNIKAQNVMFRFYVSGSSYSNINSVYVQNIEFSNGRAESGMAQIDSRYLQIKGAGVTISGCKFLRTSAFPGKGIQLYLAQNTTITNNLFGATSSTSPNPSTYGYFKTCINTNNDSASGGFVKNTSITNNNMYRNTSMANDAGNSDYGIYALGFDGLTISGNTISGWSATETGGAVKIRQGQNVTIQNNTFKRSGVLMYVYNNNPVQFLKNVNILSNSITIDTLKATPDLYQGVGFWRNFATTGIAEYAIKVQGNTINNGYIFANNANIHVADWNANNGGVFNNTINNGSIVLKSGINNSGNIIQ